MQLLDLCWAKNKDNVRVLNECTMRESGPLDRFLVIQVEVQVEFEAQVQSNKSIHTGRGSSQHKSRGSTYESRIQELRHKSVHYRHTSRGRVEALVSTGVEAQVCTSRGTRRTSRGTRHTSRGTRHTSRGTRHTSRGTRESRHQVYVEALSISTRVYGRERQQVHRHTTIHRRGTNQIRTKYTSRSTRHTSRGTTYISIQVEARVEALGIRVEAPRTSAYESRHESGHWAYE